MDTGFILVYHEKTASTFINGIQNTVRAFIRTISNSTDYYTRNGGLRKFYKSNQDKFIDIFCNNANKYPQFPLITIVRDPMIRLLSGFLDKCTTLRAAMLARRDDPHGPCKWYILLTTGIDVDTYSNRSEYIKRKLDIDRKITFDGFLKWLTNSSLSDAETQKGINSHWRNYRFNTDLEFFHSLFDVYTIDNKWIFYWIGRKLLMETNLTWISESNAIMDKWNELYLKEFEIKHAKSTNSVDKITKYFDSSDIIYLAMKWTYKDYLIFNIKVPNWICIYKYDTGAFDKLRDFLNHKFINKNYLLTTCLTGT